MLRQWREGDLEPFARLNADPDVMRHFPSLLSREQSDAMVDRLSGHIEAEGWGMWAVERRDTGEFIGFTGLAVPRQDLPFQPCVEVGWRLARDAWGHGYASEAAREALRVGFDELGLTEIVAFTAVANSRSRAVMERLGMVRDAAEDFDHPAVDVGHPVRRHVLYRSVRP
ncbi:RimJ/RimL family protein N-acetyltransferase [Ornithinibacter aureus]|nr:RimJ/RimL family protein N-acetyltransferase [Ornithinibacter aureus]